MQIHDVNSICSGCMLKNGELEVDCVHVNICQMVNDHCCGEKNSDFWCINLGHFRVNNKRDLKLNATS